MRVEFIKAIICREVLHRSDVEYSVALKVIEMRRLRQGINNKLMQLSLKCYQTLKNAPYILNLHEIVNTQEDNQIVVVTELCRGSLSNKIKMGITENQSWKYLQQIIRGYSSMYQMGVVHRDLKSDNILLSLRGEVRIGDFGFAASLQQVKKQTLFNVGSPAYMSPEVMARNQYSHSSDIWAIGIIFYEMLTGKMPWTSSEEGIRKEMNQIFIDTQIVKSRMSYRASAFLREVLMIDRYQRISPQDFINYFCNEHPLIKISSCKQKQNQLEISTSATDLRKSATNRVSYLRLKKQSCLSMRQPLNNHYQTNSSNLSSLSPACKQLSPTCSTAIKPSIQSSRSTSNLLEVVQQQYLILPTKTRTTKSSNKLNIEFIDKNTTDSPHCPQKILLYYLQQIKYIYRILIILETSEIKRRYQQDVVLVNICLKNVMIKKAEGIMNIKNSRLLKQFISQQEISVFTQSYEYHQIKLTCSQSIEKMKQSQFLLRFWANAKNTNTLCVINALYSFLKFLKIKITSNSTELLQIASKCCILMRALASELKGDNFECQIFNRDDYQQINQGSVITRIDDCLNNVKMGNDV